MRCAKIETWRIDYTTVRPHPIQLSYGRGVVRGIVSLNHHAMV
jgi:hypothetical protein